MAFKLGDMIFKEILYAWCEDRSTENPLYLLTQLSESSIEITAESSDVTDKNGNLVKKVWKSKAGTFSATNAFCNGNILAMSSDQGTTDIFATSSNKIQIPKIKILTAGDIITVGDSDSATYQMAGKVVSGKVKMNTYFEDGALGSAVTVGTSATATAASCVIDSSTGVATISAPTSAPTDGATKYIVRFYVEYSSNAAKITNSADKFPSSVRMLCFASYYDPCTKNKLKTAVIELPSFQVSPETTLSINADEPTMDFSGDLEIDYCSDDKALYHIYLDVDEEDED